MSLASHLDPTLRAREQHHRRALLIAVGGLTLLSMTPVLGHHLASRAVVALAGRDHFLNVCLVALHELMEPLHDLAHVLLVIGVAYAGWDRMRAALRLKGTLGMLDIRELPADDPIARAATIAGVSRTAIRVVRGLPTPAFTAGWISPRIYLSSDLPRLLNLAELAAVLAHEDEHRRRRDPLRLSLLRFIGCALFYVPALRRVADDLSDEAEVLADDAAASRGKGQALALASAIVALAGFRDVRMDFAGAVGFQRVDLLERRVRRLAGEDTPLGTHVTRGSLAGGVAVLAIVWLSGLMMAHPLAAETAPGLNVASASIASDHLAHCRHKGGWAILHLFCLGFASPGDPSSGTFPAHSRSSPSGVTAHCPHAGR